MLDNTQWLSPLNAQSISIPLPATWNTLISWPYVEPVDRLQVIDEDTFEQIVLERALHKYSHLGDDKVKYRSQWWAWDKGRDVYVIVNWEKGAEMSIYQCKHYKDKLQPNEMRTDIWKLCYHTFNKSYEIPVEYCIISNRWAWPKLVDYIDNPSTINATLIQQRADKCENKIAIWADSLTEELKQYIIDFDFSIITYKNPLIFLSEYSKSIYYPMRFGWGLKPFEREDMSFKLEEGSDEDMMYIKEIIKTYEERLGQSICDIDHLKSIDIVLFKQLQRHRTDFFSAEELSIYCRETIPWEMLVFKKFLDEVYNWVIDVVEKTHTTGLNRLTETLIQAGALNIASLVQDYIKVTDRKWACHHLVNENKIKWIP